MLAQLPVTFEAHGIKSSLTFHRGSFLPQSRNRLAALFMASDFDTMLMLDSDMSITPTDVMRLLGYAAKGKDFVSCAGTLRNRDPGLQIRAALDPSDLANPTVDGLLRVKHAFVAIALLRRRVFERMIEADPLLEYADTADGAPARTWNFFGAVVVDGRVMPYGEDQAFCHRATRAGIEQHVMVDCTVEHAGLTMNLAQLLAANAVQVA
jgi:hypothetical protein